jgi:hypothetical protein
MATLVNLICGCVFVYAMFTRGFLAAPRVALVVARRRD